MAVNSTPSLGPRHGLSGARGAKNRPFGPLPDTGVGRRQGWPRAWYEARRVSLGAGAGGKRPACRRAGRAAGAARARSAIVGAGRDRVEMIGAERVVCVHGGGLDAGQELAIGHEPGQDAVLLDEQRAAGRRQLVQVVALLHEAHAAGLDGAG
ncbi:hypothetical protein PG985_004902 [Apiospora marii]|uniref:uncharacterized protein n=1 Tax=Apiospora marii TaxID=335849 RepID=UPI00313015BE